MTVAILETACLNCGLAEIFHSGAGRRCGDCLPRRNHHVRSPSSVLQGSEYDQVLGVSGRLKHRPHSVLNEGSKVGYSPLTATAKVLVEMRTTGPCGDEAHYDYSSA